MTFRPNDIITNAYELYNRPQRIGMPLLNRIYLGKVRDTRDPQKMGRIKVWVPDISGNRDNPAGWFTASYCSPFAGASFVNDGYFKDTDTNQQIQSNSDVAQARTPDGGRQGYGMWFPAPDVGNDVLVAFIAGDPVNCIYFGFLFPQDQNFMVPGAPSATYTDADGLPISEGPALETDLTNINNLGATDPQRRPFGALAQGLINQGLQDDPVRGQSSASARRESPSQAYGIMTPSGHQIVYDDGDTQGNGSMIRLRTRSGAQIMIDEVTGNIYAITKNGRTWMELNDDGNFDVYGQSSISVHAENGNVNLVTSNDDINIQSAKDINFRAAGNLNFYAGKGTNIVTKLDFRSTVGGQIMFGSSGQATFASASSLSLSSGGKASLVGSGVGIGSSGPIGISASGSVDISGSAVNNNTGPGLAPDPGNIEAPSMPDIYSGLPQAPIEEGGVKKKGPNSLTAIVSRKPQAEPWDREVAGTYLSNAYGSEFNNSAVDLSEQGPGFSGNAGPVNLKTKAATEGALGKILDIIAKHESPTGSYSITLGGRDEPRLLNMTIGQVIDYQTNRLNTDPTWKRLGSTACGRYQFLRSTLRGLTSRGQPFKTTDRFDPKTQDRMAMHLANNMPEKFLLGKVSTESLIKKLASQWESIPGGPDNRAGISGKSNGKTVTRAAKWKWDEIGSALNNLKGGSANG